MESNNINQISIIFQIILDQRPYRFGYDAKVDLANINPQLADQF